MARWILLAVTILGFVLAFTTKSVGLLALGLLLSLAGMIGFAFALAASRISASARPETSMASVEDLAALRKVPTAAARRTPAATAPGRTTGNDADRPKP